jgi:membrane protein implicated in regulation of membrane protease activity
MVMSAKVRVSPISKTAALLIIAIGVFVLFTGLVADVLASEVAGAAFIILGLILYGVLFRFTRKLERDINSAKP